ncbi:hypothetical protein [Nocardia altamirensis]|uniref:hypothetical protein n=1 Tax=Nocardia altamirensis TaxID=472158 RepID=UPI0008401665|nr:hypothetical protein [Nocardia altamirensis]
MSEDMVVPEPVIEAELLDEVTTPEVYVVTTGEYAYRQELAAFEDRDDARKWAILYNAHVPWNSAEDKAVAAEEPVPFMRRGGVMPPIPGYDPGAQ